MDISFELDRKRDVATIPLHVHHPLIRTWSRLPVSRECVLQTNEYGELVALEVSRKRLEQWGVRLPCR